jgi:prepilin-type N-terminal cleavage/methylation domain-containing protein
MPGTAARAGSTTKSLRAFTLIELLVVILVILILVGLLLPALAKGRKNARTVICMSNMRQVGMGLINYAGDGKSWLGVFSWQPNRRYQVAYPDLDNAPFAFTAHAWQAVYIARKVLQEPSIMRVDNRMLSRNYSYMPLVDGGYLADGLPNRAVACPEDRDTISWQRNFIINRTNPTFDTPDPDQGGDTAFHQFLPFWSTYQTVPAAWSEQTGFGALSQADVPSVGNHLLYWYYDANTQHFFNTRLDKVGFPSSKVYLFDLFDRHAAKQNLFHAYGFAKQPLAFFDGHVGFHRTDDANRGWNPTNPNSTTPTVYYYYPGPGEPRTISGNAYDQVYGWYRWTRNGIKGVDFGGGEVR